jgi:hypothetical protein
MSDNAASASNSGQTETAGLDFLDFVFTVAMSIGLTPEILGGDFKGMLSEEWLRDGRWPAGGEWFNLGVFGFGFLNLTLSWFGYHASIRNKRLKWETIVGMFRFVLDVLLVIIYGLMLIKYKQFGVVLANFSAVFVMFVVWDVLKIIEHWKEKYQRLWLARRFRAAFRRELVSGLYALLVALLWIAYSQWGLPRWSALVLALAITVLYRIHKKVPLLGL